MLKKPELLAPAGNLEKLKAVFEAGADAAYLGGTIFGLRKQAENFSVEELIIAKTLSQEKNKKIYIVLNGFAHNDDIPSLITHLKDLIGLI